MRLRPILLLAAALVPAAASAQAKPPLKPPTVAEGHGWLAAALPRLTRPAAARKFLAAGAAAADYEWSPEVVGLLALLPDAEVRPLVPTLWERGGLEDALLPLLALAPTESDRGRFVVRLGSPSSTAVATAAGGLARLPAPADPGPELAAAVRAMRTLGGDPAAGPAREAVVALLRRRSGQDFAADANRWEAWLSATHPAAAKRLGGVGGYDPAAWKDRLAAVSWAAGDPAAGKRVFAKTGCVACHDGGGAVGPSLAGVGRRFGRDDLLTAVLDPDRDISPRYRTTRVSTTDGKVYEGVVIYEATDGMILRTGPETTVRVAGDRIEAKKSGVKSLMPSGLLDPLSGKEIADLFAFLRGL